MGDARLGGERRELDGRGGRGEVDDRVGVEHQRQRIDHDRQAARRAAGEGGGVMAEPGRVLALERAGERQPLASWIARTTMRPMRPAAPATMMRKSAIA